MSCRCGATSERKPPHAASEPIATPHRASRLLGTDGDCKYLRKEKIGEGACGTAFIVQRVSDGARFVAKEVDLSSMSEHERCLAEEEIKCLSTTHHFAVLKLIEHVREGERLILITEFADAGDLRRQIRARAQSSAYFDERAVWQVLLQVLLAFSHIHGRNILHRDVKPANIFVTKQGLVKIGDFGLSRVYDTSVSTLVATSYVGTRPYVAPELWLREKYNEKADMWSIGVTMYEMMALRRPFDVGTDANLAEGTAHDVVSGVVPPPLPSCYKNELKAIVMRLLDRDSSARPSALELLRYHCVQEQLRVFQRSIACTASIPVEVREEIVDCVHRAECGMRS